MTYKLSPFFLLFVLGYVLCSQAPQPPPNFSDTYIVKGTLYVPYAEIREPFYVWYDLKLGASRIDYYGGMAKTYQLSKAYKYGTMMKIVPVTTEKETNEVSCLQVNGTSNFSVEPQSILPDLTGFKYIGSEPVHGVDCEKWQLVDKKEDKLNKYTIWIRYKKSSTNSDARITIPVKYQMKGYNTLLGSHYDHYYLMYEWYSPESPSPDVFKLNDNLTCTQFPGPGEKHFVTFNPMSEFVNHYDRHVESEFNSFKQRHGRMYDSDTEHNKRKEIFRQNLRFINAKNREVVGFRLGVNHLSDRTDLELKALRGKQYTGVENGGAPFPYRNVKEMLRGLPASIDWRLYGAVTPVKDQSVCGSCWSFGTTGAIEGAYFVKYGHLERFSQQALIDCSWGFGNNGCDGGEDFRSYQWMMKHGGLPLEDEYGGYLGQDGYCHVDNVTLTGKITGYVNVTTGDQDALKVALAKHGPISIAIDASRKTFSFYSNGVYYDPECHNKPEQLDHAVLLVGYGDINGHPYWLVKNSWSTYWGNDGYVLISQKNNNCGVATDPTYVTM